MPSAPKESPSTVATGVQLRGVNWELEQLTSALIYCLNLRIWIGTEYQMMSRNYG